jgi:hypothetical protein
MPEIKENQSTMTELINAESQYRQRHKNHSKKIQILRKDRDDRLPWIDLADWRQQLKSLVNRNKVVIESSKVRVMFDYPLHNPCVVTFSVRTPTICKKQLIKLIARKYEKIYEEEEKTTIIPVSTIPNMYNRNTTNGTYGIWGHILQDLSLNGLEYNEENAYWELSINS